MSRVRAPSATPNGEVLCLTFFFCPLYDGDPKVQWPKFMVYNKEQGKSVRHSVETLTERLNKHNDDLFVTKAQVYAAAKHLLDHKLIEGVMPLQNSIIILSITPEGEDLIDSEFNV